MLGEPYVLWFVLGIALSVMEIFTAGFFIIWFGIAGLLTALIAYLHHNFLLELGAFTLFSIILLALTKPLVAKINAAPNVPSNVDALKGKTALVIAEICNVEGKGLVKVDGETWSARTSSDEVLKENTWVRIEQVEGAKLIVSKKD